MSTGESSTTLWETIEAAYERDQEDPGRPAVEASDIPLAYENITPQWLTAILCADTPEAEAVGFELGDPDDGSTNRRLIGVEYNDKGRAAGLPEKVFAKANHGLTTRLILGISGAGPAEVDFYNDVRTGLEIEAPVCYHAVIDPASFNGIILLEDLSDKVTEFCTHTTKMPLARAQSQMRNLAKLHSTYWGKADTASGQLRHFPSFPEYLTNLVNQMKMDEGCIEGFRAGEAVIPPELYARAEEVWPKTMQAAALHDKSPKTLAHGDVHLKNWYALPHDEMGLSDWQCTHRGSWARDFAYTVSTALTPEDRRAWEEDLLRYYLEHLHAAGGPSLDFDEAFTAYRQQLLPALAWWTITLRPTEGMPDMQPEDTTLEFVRRISIAMDDLGSLDLL